MKTFSIGWVVVVVGGGDDGGSSGWVVVVILDGLLLVVVVVLVIEFGGKDHRLLGVEELVDHRDGVCGGGMAGVQAVLGDGGGGCPWWEKDNERRGCEREIEIEIKSDYYNGLQ